MLKRNGQVARHGRVNSEGAFGDQLSLFDFARSREQRNLSNPIRTHGRTPLAGVPAEDGLGIGEEWDLDGSVVRSAGANNRRNGSADEEIGDGAETDSTTGARPRLGGDSGAIHSPTARESLNANNYRIRPEDALGRGSLKHRCRDNFAAIELIRRLDAEGREATEDEKRVLVRYVGWGGIPQVFADLGSSEWNRERKRLKELLTPVEYEFARASTLNAHYTSGTVVSAIYDGVQRWALGISLD
jgi:hypothetical protein